MDDDDRPQILRAGELLVCAYPVAKTGSAWRSFLRRERARRALGAGQVVATVREPQREDDRLVWIGFGTWWDR